MKMLRLATNFERKITKTAAQTFQQIESLYRLIKNLINQKGTLLANTTQKDSLSSTLRNLGSIAQIYYLNARNYGISGSQHANYLNQIKNNLDQVSQMAPSTNSQVQNVKSNIDNIIPIALKAQIPTPSSTAVSVPVTSVKPNKQYLAQQSGNLADIMAPKYDNTTDVTPTNNEDFKKALERMKQLSEEFGKPLPAPSQETQDAWAKFKKIRPDAFPTEPPTEEQLSKAIPRPKPLPWDLDNQ